MYLQDSKTAVENLLKTYSNALNASDAASIAKLYVADGLFLPDGAPAMEGREEIEHSAERFLKKNKVGISFYVRNIIVEGQFAFVQATSECSVQQRLTGKEVLKTGKDFFVLRKEEQQWKIFHYMFNN